MHVIIFFVSDFTSLPLSIKKKKRQSKKNRNVLYDNRIDDNNNRKNNKIKKETKKKLTRNEEIEAHSSVEKSCRIQHKMNKFRMTNMKRKFRFFFAFISYFYDLVHISKVQHISKTGPTKRRLFN